MADKEELEMLKGLLPIIGVGTVGIVAFALLGRAFTGRRAYAQDGQYLVSVRYPGQRHDLREFVQPDNPDIIATLSQIGPAPWSLYDFVCRNIDYRRDWGEFFQWPSETIALRRGDCFPGDTPIVCIENERYAIKQLADLENHKGVKALSYNFGNQSFEAKPITNFMKKGVRQIVKVKLRNGTELKCTPEHRFFRTNQAIFNRHWFADGVQYRGRKRRHWFFEQPLAEIGAGFNNNHALACAREMPALNKLPRLKLPQLFVEGTYAAEGSYSRSACRIAGSDPSYKFQIASSLLQLNTPFSMSGQGGNSCFTVKKSPLKAVLEQMGHNAFTKQFIENRLSCSIEQLEFLLDGYAKGDGWFNPKGNSHGVRGYDTVSNKLAAHLRFIHLVLGRPLCSCYKKPSGQRKSPIWSLKENPASAFNKEIIPGLSRVSVSSIEEAGKDEVYDITVADNHNFLLADSFVLAHNCEDTSILLTSLLRNFNDAHVALGSYRGYGHAWCEHQGQVLETTYTSARPVPDPEDYCPYVIFNDHEVVELWPGALDEVFELRRDEATKIQLMAGVIG